MSRVGIFYRRHPFEALTAAGEKPAPRIKAVVMPRFYVRTCNSDLETIDDGESYALATDALERGIDAALHVASDEIRQGQRSAAVDVRVEDAGGKEQLRSVVALSVSPLLVDAGSAVRPNHADND